MAVQLDATFGALPLLFHGGESWSQDSLKTVESVVLLHWCGKALTTASKEGQRLRTFQAINSLLIQCFSLNVWQGFRPEGPSIFATDNNLQHIL